MNNWRNIKLDDLDLTLLPMTGNTQKQIKKFFSHAQSVGLLVWEYSSELNERGGRYIINEYKQICETVGDLVDCEYRTWTYTRNIGYKTTRTIAKLINILAEETIFTDSMIGIGRPLEQRKDETRAKWKQIYEDHKAGKSWGDIAKKLNISENSVRMMDSKYRKENNIPASNMIKTWQPIETAPKDGLTDILMFQNGGIYMATWSRLGPLPNKKFGWMSNTGYQLEPTHWMPLPGLPR